MAGLGERLLQAEPLEPVLQDVGELPLGQAQSLVQRHPLDLLALPAAVDEPLEAVLAEDRHVAAVAWFLQTAERATVVRFDGFTHVTVPAARDVLLQQLETYLQQHGQRFPLQQVDPQIPLLRLLHKPQQPFKRLPRLEKLPLFRDDHCRASVRWTRDFRRSSSFYLTRLPLCEASTPPQLLVPQPASSRGMRVTPFSFTVTKK